MAAPSKSDQRGPLVPQHKRLAQGVNVGKKGEGKAAPAPVKTGKNG